MNHQRDLSSNEDELWDSCDLCGSVRAAQLHPARCVNQH